MALGGVIGTSLAASINNRRSINYDQVLQAQPILMEMKRTKAFTPWGGGGYFIEVPINTGKNKTFQWTDYKAQQELTETDTDIVVTFKTAYVSGNITWYKRDEIANRGRQRVYNFVENKKKQGIQSAKEQMALGLWQDGSGKLPDGMMGMLSLGGMWQADGKTANTNYGVFGANTYATIDRSVAANSYWMPRSGPAYTVDYQNGAPAVTYGPYNTAIPLAFFGTESIEKLFQDCSQNGGAGNCPNIAFTTQALYMEALAQLAAKVSIKEGENARMVDAGFPNHFVYNGATVTWDQNAPAGVFGFLNTNHFNVCAIEDYDDSFVADEVSKLNTVGVDGFTILMTWAGNFVCDTPGTQGVLTAKT